MFGVASMLCRLGVRPYSTSTLASQVVADFMAVLAYVKFESEGYLSSYASDPVLALGAIKVWHFLKDGLSKYILPQLKKLILDEALDTGGICEMVARILLLLAMDKCVMRDRIKPKGQFVSVESFLNVMGGSQSGRTGAWGSLTSYSCRLSRQKIRCGICWDVGLRVFSLATSLKQI
ncbi:uncharacterized protein PITG_17885 [Phytophthora infestans T30-4]|uniref:Uncharacterized protein n=1 Tax=Phytophthora infestans (strain T30-4) TaxID=403677 RepID=D0NWX8_PHYIT|nr:uncharacterized protein PITG_17885 [Phytophthora infestans T30-4]EEY67565.1 conserved hypothetical protein [Phytophthora infestans T30-4]|eukprot:XP_002896424.1 conserved hypothetical protein [Phytophthora infestans T30-4]